jgi:hypothetical protein
MKNETVLNFGTKYFQFKHKGKEAIKHLIKVKEGECISAMHRHGIGDIDVVWGENDSKNKGFGLKHIIEKHGKEILQLGFKVEDFIPIIVQFGELKEVKENDRISLEGKMFRIVISKAYHQDGQKIKKNFVLTSFDLRPLTKKPSKK